MNMTNTDSNEGEQEVKYSIDLEKYRSDATEYADRYYSAWHADLTIP